MIVPEPKIQQEDLQDLSDLRGVDGPGKLFQLDDPSSARYAAALSADFALWSVVARVRAEALEGLGRYADAARARDFRAKWREIAYRWHRKC